MLSTLVKTWKIPDSKLLPRSIYDVLTQISNYFQQSFCRVQCRQTVTGQLVVRSRCGASLFVFQTFSSFVFYQPSVSRSARLMSVTDDRAALSPLHHELTRPFLLIGYWKVCFGTGPDSKIHSPPLKMFNFIWIHTIYCAHLRLYILYQIFTAWLPLSLQNVNYIITKLCKMWLYGMKIL